MINRSGGMDFIREIQFSRTKYIENCQTNYLADCNGGHAPADGGAVKRGEGDLLQCADDEPAIEKHLPDRSDRPRLVEKRDGEAELIVAGV